MFDATIVSIQHFSATTVALPDGPKAVVMISDGDDNASDATLNDAVDAAGIAGIPVFTIAVPTASQAGRNILNSMAARTGGEYIPAADDAAVTEAYGTISTLLDNSYLLTFASSITDCNQHEIRVQVAGQSAPATVRFTRCDAVTLRLPHPAGGGGGGGGGALGLMEFLTGLILLFARRRRHA